MNKIKSISFPFQQKLLTLSREKVDTLFLIVTCCLVLYPFFEHNPDWLNAIAAGLILWRLWITWHGRALPQKWQLALVTAAFSTAVYLHFHTWLGKEAGIAFLIAMVCLKMLELHARRDAMAVVFVCYFLLVGQLLYSQTLLSALYLVFCSGLLISVQLSYQYHLSAPTFSKRVLSGFKVVSLAIPLALMLFLFFPRIQGPLWGKQQGNMGGITGLSDSMEPGNVAELALSDQIAFRVRFNATPPASAQLYWRAIVLDTFDGSRWTASPSGRQTRLPQPPQGNLVTQEIFLEPHNQTWIFGLDRPGRVTRYNGAALDNNSAQLFHLTGYYEMRSANRIQDRIQYTITSNLSGTGPINQVSQVSTIENVDDQSRSLQLPAGYNPRTIQWATQLSGQSNDPIQLANLVLQFFHQQPFKYTLAPDPLGVNQIDDFMFGTQAGFCEHYASAFVVVMRALHIPARVVTGYQGGEINPIDGLMTVRQSDAHAWAEIWVDHRGWIRMDPTAAVAPSRVERGMRSAFPNHDLSSLLNFGPQSWLANLTRQIRSTWDATNSAWNLWVLNYSLGKQLDLLKSLSGIEHPQAAQLGIAMMIGASLVVAILSLILLGKKNVSSPLDRLYLRFCRHMGHQGFARMPHEGALNYSLRLQPYFPNQSELTDFLSLYTNCKYGKGYNSDQLIYLKKLLKLCFQLKPARSNSKSSNPLPH